MTRQPEGQSKFRKYRAILRNFCLRDRKWCSTADGNGGCHRRAPSSSKEITWTTRCRGQNHCRQWPGNTMGWSKFHEYHANYRNLRLRDRDWCSSVDGGFQRSLKLHVDNVKNITGDNQITISIAKAFKICLQDQVKPLKILAAKYHLVDTITTMWTLLPPCGHYCTMLISS